jgi:hypothetical protein
MKYSKTPYLEGNHKKRVKIDAVESQARALGLFTFSQQYKPTMVATGYLQVTVDRLKGTWLSGYTKIPVHILRRAGCTKDPNSCSVLRWWLSLLLVQHRRQNQNRYSLPNLLLWKFHNRNTKLFARRGGFVAQLQCALPGGEGAC